MRVHELAKELNLDSKALISKLKEIGIGATSHMSSLSETQTKDAIEKLAEAITLKSEKHRKKTSDEAAAEPAMKASKKASEITNENEAGEVNPDIARDTLVEQRVSRTVIRRRKRVVPESVEPELAEPENIEQASAALEQVEPELAAPELVEQESTAPKPPEEDKSATEAKEEKEKQPEEAETKTKAHKKTVPEPPDEEEAEKLKSKAAAKKVKIKGKESTPARIIDRIELRPKKENRQIPVSGDESEVVTEGLKEDLFSERAKRGAVKEQPKRNKFRWGKEIIDTEETDKDVFIKRRKRYKITEKFVKGKRHKTDVVQLDLKNKEFKEPEKTVPKAIKRKIRVHESITVVDLSKRIGIKSKEVIKKLVELGIMASLNHPLDIDTASLIASDFGYEIESVSIAEETIFDAQAKDLEKDLKPRFPVVTVMGHVDHGKTSLLDTIRNTNITGIEKGGITQHIGAYRVSLKEGDITFVDTPGHEAFTAMRARGAGVTDIVILVVAADEGVKPQTIEAINHAKAAGVPIIVAINKIDKHEANPEKVIQELSSYGLLQEEWGGDTIFVEVSAKNKTGIEKLLEMTLLQAEMLELKANPDKPAKGTIIEARLDRGRGPIATVLVQEGTLKPGDSFVSRHNFGKVRAIIDDRGRNIKEAGPSMPVEIVGFSGTPESGDIFIAVDEKKAKQTSSYWQLKKREEDLRKDTRISLENFLSTVEGQSIKELRLIIKADVQGSIEALRQSLENLSTDEVRVNVIHSSVGAVSLNDVMLASASKGIVIGFGVKSEAKIYENAEIEKVDIRLYDIIYDVIDDVRKAMLGLLAPRRVEKPAGKAEIKEVFEISKYGTVAGCIVIEGKVVNGSNARIIRGSEVIHEGYIKSLKRFKEDTKEALSGQDCGIYLENFKDFALGDIIESFFVDEVERTVL